jgi:hypothetical protein
VLRGFVSASNAQYRRAGLDEYQMRVHADGRVTVPNRPDPEFNPVKGTGSAAAQQAQAGAAQQGAAPSAGAVPSGAAAPGDGGAARAGSAPRFTSLKPTPKGFALRWEAVPGAEKYGIYVDGALVGHVPKPSFDGTVGVGTGGVIQVDAVAADGTRTQPTAPMHVARVKDGTLEVTDPQKAQAAAAATAPAPAAT